MSHPTTLGFDFGTDSVRLVIVDVATGRILDQETRPYTHGVLDRTLPNGIKLPPDAAYQHPLDWIHDAAAASRTLMRRARTGRSSLVGIGVDFTSCTMLPCTRDGTPLCLLRPFARTAMAWPKLWKHHGAKEQSQRITALARATRQRWLKRYGGSVSLEWLFPKVLETLEQEPRIYREAELFIEAGDWFVWQLTTGIFPHSDPTRIIRSTCQAGYKACWSEADGYPPRKFLRRLHPELEHFAAAKMPGQHLAPGTAAGQLSAPAARVLGLPPGLPVSTAIIDAHAGVPGAGVSRPGEMVTVIGTSTGHMMNHTSPRPVPGISGIVKDGILPGYYGYEGGQASVGDAYAWVVRATGQSHAQLTRAATQLPPGSGGILATDFFNGCRAPMMDGRLSGSLIGLTLGTTPGQIYRAVVEATAFGARWIFDTLQGHGVPIRRYIASGGLPRKSPLVVQIYADVLGRPIRVAAESHAVALGSAILGALAAGPQKTGYKSLASAISAMAPQDNAVTYRPNPRRAQTYQRLYDQYIQLMTGPVRMPELMHALRDLNGESARGQDQKRGQ